MYSRIKKKNFSPKTHPKQQPNHVFPTHSQRGIRQTPQKLHNFFIKYPPRPFAQYKDGPSTTTDPLRNPFFPNKNQESGNWQSAKFSRRRSADLFKLAKKFGIHDLLPPTPRKFHEDKYTNKLWLHGMINPASKAKQEELDAKLKARAEAIANMDNIIIATRPSYKKLLEREKT